MTSSALQTIGVIVGIFSVIIAALAFQRQGASALRKERADAIASAVKDAREPLLTEIAELRDTVKRREDRIDTLEDELRRGRGYGDNDRSRQPR